MLLENKKFVIEKKENLTVKHIEDFISSLGYIPLRWAITDVKENELIIESINFKK